MTIFRDMRVRTPSSVGCAPRLSAAFTSSKLRTPAFTRGPSGVDAQAVARRTNRARLASLRMPSLYFPPMRRLAPAITLLLAVAPITAAQEITFHFAPPVGKTFVQKIETTITNVDDGKPTTTSETAESALTYEKRDGGYLLRGKTSGIEITYAMDANAQVSEIHGLDRMLEMTLKKVDPSMRAQYAAVVNEEALINREEAEWDGRVGYFVGKTVKIGDQWAERTPFPVPGGGELSFYIVTTFKSLDDCPAGKCVRITFTSSTDARKLGDVVKKVLKSEDFTYDGFTVEGSGERLIDPNTMTIYAETMSRTIEVALGDVKSTRNEVRKYTFKY